MKTLSPELVAALLKGLRDEKWNHQEKLLVIKLMQEDNEGKLSREDFKAFVKTFFRLAPFLTKVLIE